MVPQEELDSSVTSLILADALPYELMMLEQTFVRLSLPQLDGCIANALIESFCVHARQLIDFFENKQGVRADQFTNGTYEAAHLSSVPRSVRKKLNHQIAHITQKRTADPSEKVGPEERAHLLLTLVLEAQRFISLLSEFDQGIVRKKYLSVVNWGPAQGQPTASPDK
jgi:hypothetical protein